MWTEQDIRVARSFDKEQKRLLRKMAVQPTRNDEELQKNMVALDNERFGELMKVMVLKRQDVLALVDGIERIAKTKLDKEKTKNPIAPR